MIAVLPPSTTPALAPPEITERKTISTLQQTVSASRLTLFLQCRLKFYFRYVLALPKPKTPALHVGNTVHEVLKAWHKARWLGHPLSLKQTHESFELSWQAPPEGKQNQAIDWQGQEADAKLTAWRLCETYLRESATTALSAKPEAVEVPVEAVMDNHGLPRLIGILDLVQCGHIIDYKTTSSTPNAEKVGHLHEVQTSIYAILYRHNTGRQEEGIELHHLVKLKHPKLVITSLPPMDDRQQRRLFRLLEGYVEGLDRSDFVPSPGLQCQSCEFFNECRQWQ